MEKQVLIDDNDLRKIKEIKDKFVRLKLYEEAAECRHVENTIIHHIHKQKECKKRKEMSYYAINFASFVLKHFVATQGEINGEKFLAYLKNGDTSKHPKQYTPSDVHDFYIEYRTAKQFEEKTGWSFNDPSDLTKIRNQFTEKPNPAAGMV